MPKTVVIGAFFGIVMLGIILYLSMGFSQYTCEVCVTFKGRTKCRTASGAAQDSAMLAARDNACAYLVATKTDGFLCNQTQPTSIECQEP